MTFFLLGLVFMCVYVWVVLCACVRTHAVAQLQEHHITVLWVLMCLPDFESSIFTDQSYCQFFVKLMGVRKVGDSDVDLSLLCVL